VTVSHCVVDAFPDNRVLPGVEAAPEDLRRLRESLALSEPDLAELREWGGRALDDGTFGRPNVFPSLSAARAFRRRFLVLVNEKGLLDDFAHAVAAAECANRDDVGSGRVAWYPFRVDATA